MTLITIRLGDYFLFIIIGGFIIRSYLGLYTRELKLVEISCLILLAFTKRAQFPFSGWLPKAIRAPTPTSALVHSSTLVTAGLVLLITYRELVSNSTALIVITFVGLLTILGGSISALVERRIKKVVAFSTLSQIGLGIITYGLGGFRVGYYNLVAHGFAKRLLFIQVGYLIHSMYNQQNRRSWSYTTQVCGFIQVQLLLRLASLCGTTFYSGIVRKELILDSYYIGSWGLIFLVSITVSVYLTLVYRLLIYSGLFNSSIVSLTSNHTRVTIIICTLIESVLVISYFSWLSSNVVSHYYFNYIEVLFPLSVLVIIRLLVSLITRNRLNYISTHLIRYIYNGLHYYR